MRPMRLATLCLACMLCLGAFVPLVAYAAPGSDLQGVPSGTVHHGSYYVHSPEIRVAGEVDGDLVALATQRLVISGVVRGSVLAYGGDIIIEPGAVVIGSLRVLGGSLTMAGTVRGDATPGVQRLLITPKGTVGGNLYYWAGNTDIQGAVLGEKVPIAPPGMRQGWIGQIAGTLISLLVLALLCRSCGLVGRALPHSPLSQALLGLGIVLMTVPLAGLAVIVPALRLPAVALCLWVGSALTIALYDMIDWVGSKACGPLPPALKARAGVVPCAGSVAATACFGLPVLWVLPAACALAFVPGRLIPLRNPS